MKKSIAKLLVKEIIKEVLKQPSLKENKVDENWRGLATAGMMGLAALHPTGQQYLGKAKQAWTQQANRQQANRQQATQQRQFQNPTQELPSEKSMGGFDLAQKYSDRNASLAKKLKPATNAWLKENDGVTPTNPIEGQSNIVAASRVNKILSAMSQGMFSDNSWEAINKIFKKLQEAGLEVTVTSAKYGGHADVPSGMPKFKEWQISIPFTNKTGKPTVLVGQITAHGAGSIDQPLDRYDITAYVSPMNVKL